MFDITSFAAMAPNQQYLQSVQAITGYNQMITNQSEPAGLPNAAAISQAGTALTQARQVSMNWFNQVYPACLNLPQNITGESSGITTSLQELTTLAGQLAADPGNTPLAQAVTNTANQLTGQVTQLQTNCSGMGNTLNQYAGSLQQAAQGLMSSVGGLQSLMITQHNQWYNDVAQLNSLQHATCPNQSDINAAQTAVNNDQQALAVTDQFTGQINNCGQSAGSAVSGLSYLAGYWMQLGTLANQAVQALQQISGQPAAVIKLDLQTASNAWQGLLDQLSAITTLAAAEPVAAV
jgi:hypothetical protein